MFKSISILWHLKFCTKMWILGPVHFCLELQNSQLLSILHLNRNVSPWTFDVVERAPTRIRAFDLSMLDTIRGRCKRKKENVLMITLLPVIEVTLRVTRGLLRSNEGAKVPAAPLESVSIVSLDGCVLSSRVEPITGFLKSQSSVVQPDSFLWRHAYIRGRGHTLHLSSS